MGGRVGREGAAYLSVDGVDGGVKAVPLLCDGRVGHAWGRSGGDRGDRGGWVSGERKYNNELTN